ncbi:hypothetical protein [Aminobacter sp. MET-1]|uniref:hypothetical protein n=1 Tax=Aminobacter sp. MET-1 TaxID=2951085 RepID=UPI00226A7BF2|nr:hypothetical protein [Aminobacter sp. MET-1]MCX8570734.1 hypothetical protein [Aminobacter sp. MET-1]
MNDIDVLRQHGLDLRKLPPLFREIAREREFAAIALGLVGCEPAARIGQMPVIAFLLALEVAYRLTEMLLVASPATSA